MTSLKPLTLPRVEDAELDRVSREIGRAVGELQQLPAAFLDVIPNVTLRDGVDTPIAHKLGRSAKWVKESCVRGAVTAGVVTEVRSTKHDTKQYVVLRAEGFGGDVTCTVAVM